MRQLANWKQWREGEPPIWLLCCLIKPCETSVNQTRPKLLYRSCAHTLPWIMLYSTSCIGNYMKYTKNIFCLFVSCCFLQLVIIYSQNIQNVQLSGFIGVCLKKAEITRHTCFRNKPFCQYYKERPSQLEVNKPFSSMVHFFVCFSPITQFISYCCTAWTDIHGFENNSTWLKPSQFTPLPINSINVY